MNFNKFEVISKKTKKLSNLIGKEHTDKILHILYKTPNKSASEIAKILNIHIATAQSYLEDLEKFDIVKFRIRKEGIKPYKEYFLIKTKIRIEIDLNELDKVDQKEQEILRRTRIREKKDLKILYEINQEKSIIKRIHFYEDIGRKNIQYSLDLDELEGRFTWFIPFPSAELQTILKICEKAGIYKIHQQKIIELIKKLEEFGLIEVVFNNKEV
ncbi:MAG: hypothetical protein ACFFD2_04380 [Promethearchaeota archaeon]